MHSKVWSLSSTCQTLPKLVAVSPVAGSPELVCSTPPLYTVATLQLHTHAVLVCSNACSADKTYVNAVQWVAN